MTTLNKITLIGCGSIGSLIASELNNKKNTITIVDKGENLKKIKKDGLKIIYSNIFGRSIQN